MVLRCMAMVFRYVAVRDLGVMLACLLPLLFALQTNADQMCLVSLQKQKVRVWIL